MSQYYPRVEYTISALPYEHDIESAITIMEAKLIDSDTENTLASCEVYSVDFLLGKRFTHCHDLLDVHGVTYEFSPLFRRDYDIRASICRDLDIYHAIHRLVIIHNLEVPKEYRGHKLSKVLIDDIERRFTGLDDLLALKSYPLENNTKATTKSLTKYYNSIAFHSTGVNDILVRLQC